MKSPSPMTDNRKAAVVLAKACLRAQLSLENPGIPGDELKTRVADKWSTSRQAYVKMGNQIIRRLERAGYALTPAPDAAPRAAAKRTP